MKQSCSSHPQASIRAGVMDEWKTLLMSTRKNRISYAWEMRTSVEVPFLQGAPSREPFRLAPVKDRYVDTYRYTHTYTCTPIYAYIYVYPFYTPYTPRNTLHTYLLYIYIPIYPSW